jgi:hypothetical protein
MNNNDNDNNLTESEKEEITQKLLKLAGVPQNRIEKWRRKWNRIHADFERIENE